MMQELSMNILDVAENAVSAGASLIDRCHDCFFL